jgi:hypothetical protein
MKFIAKFSYVSSGEKRIIKISPIDMKLIDPLIKMGFDRDDIKFVKIAPKTGPKTIISSDPKSFLRNEFSTWIKNNLNVVVKSPIDYCSL